MKDELVKILAKRYGGNRTKHKVTADKILSLMGENKAGGSDASTEHGNYTHVRVSNAHGEGVESSMASVAKPLGKRTEPEKVCPKCGQHQFVSPIHLSNGSTHYVCIYQSCQHFWPDLKGS